MRITLFIFLFMFSSVSFAQNESENGLNFINQQDKQLHAFASYAINYTAYTYFRSKKVSKTRSLVYSTLLTIAIGAIKESSDPQWDSQDMKANALGTGISASSIILIDF